MVCIYKSIDIIIFDKQYQYNWFICCGSTDDTLSMNIKMVLVCIMHSERAEFTTNRWKWLSRSVWARSRHAGTTRPAVRSLIPPPVERAYTMRSRQKLSVNCSSAYGVTDRKSDPSSSIYRWRRRSAYVNRPNSWHRFYVVQNMCFTLSDNKKTNTHKCLLQNVVGDQ